MEVVIGYAYIFPIININILDCYFHNLKLASELCYARDIKFSVHLGHFDSNKSIEWWIDLMKRFEGLTISNLIINLELTTGNQSKMEWFEKKYNQLPDCIEKILKLENDANNCSVSEVVTISETIGIPVIVNLYNDMRYPSAPLNESIDRIIKRWPTYDLIFSYVDKSHKFEISKFEKFFNELHHKEELMNKKINLIVVSSDYQVAIRKITTFLEHKNLQEEFLRMVDSKLRKSEKEIWFNPDHDHMEKHLK